MSLTLYPDLVLHRIANQLACADFAALQQTDKRMHLFLSDVPMANALAEQRRKLASDLCRNPSDVSARQQADEIDRLRRYGMQQPNLGESARRWQLTPPQVQGLRNGLRFGDFPELIRDLMVAYPDVIEELDLRGRQGDTGYIDFLELNDFKGVVAAGQDIQGRQFLSLKLSVTTRPIGSERPLNFRFPGVCTIFQRHPVPDSAWVAGSEVGVLAHRFLPNQIWDLPADHQIDATHDALHRLLATGTMVHIPDDLPALRREHHYRLLDPSPSVSDIERGAEAINITA